MPGKNEALGGYNSMNDRLPPAHGAWFPVDTPAPDRDILTVEMIFYDMDWITKQNTSDDEGAQRGRPSDGFNVTFLSSVISGLLMGVV